FSSHVYIIFFLFNDPSTYYIYTFPYTTLFRSKNSFNYFAVLGKDVPDYYSYDVGGFRNWFNGVLLRGYLDLYPEYEGVANYVHTFQQNLDYGFDHYLQDGVLPTDLLKGWSKDEKSNQVEGMFQFTFAAEYAVLARFEYNK